MMAKLERDEEREERITMDIVVDAYDAEEQAMGWYDLRHL
jgi:Calcium binding